MFPIHDRTRRWICRTIFIFGGVLPMLAVAAWAAVIHSASHLEAVRVRVEEALGLQVRLASVSYPQPGATLLAGMELLDPESGEALGSIRMVEMIDEASCKTIVLSQLEINVARPRWLWNLIDNRLRLWADQTPMRLSASELTARWNGGVQTFVDCNAQLESTSKSHTITAAFQLANVQAREPIGLHIERSSKGGQPASSVSLDARSAALPASLLAALMERGNYLGEKSTLRSAIRAQEMPDGWEGEFTGQLENVDLNSLVSDQFPHRLSGTASVTVEKAIVHRSRLEEFRGTISAGRGVVSESLLASAAESLNMRRELPRTVAGRVMQYEELSATFDLDTRGLLLRGQCGKNGSGIIMRGREGAILWQSSAGPTPVVNLVKALVPDSRTQVPATRQTDWLLNLLPIPDVLPHDPSAPPEARLRAIDAPLRK